VAIDVAEQIVDVFEGRSARSAVNLPALSPEVLAAVQPYLPLAEKMASLAAQTTEGRPERISIRYSGELASIETGPITRSVLVGLLRPVMGESVNLVNAPVMAKSRGVEVVDSKSADGTDYASLLSITVKTDKGENEIAGTLFGTKDMRVVKMGGFPMDLVPEGYMLVAPHSDKPGIIGRVGTILGTRSINIASMYVGRKTVGENAIMVLNVDSQIPADVLEEITAIEGIDSAKQVQL
jgi:D-3-phosphoglycerate dehydrogenase